MAKRFQIYCTIEGQHTYLANESDSKKQMMKKARQLSYLKGISVVKLSDTKEDTHVYYKQFGNVI